MVNFWLLYENLFLHDPRILRTREKDSRKITVHARAHLALPVRVAQVSTCHHKAASLLVHTNRVVNLLSQTQASDANQTQV